MHNTTQERANRELGWLVTAFIFMGVVGFVGLFVISTSKVEMGPLAGSAVDFTYYSKFHHNRKIIEATPGWTITNDWKHEDVTLEDFGFTVRIESGKVAEVDFYEYSPQMDLSGESEIRDFARREIERGARRGW